MTKAMPVHARMLLLLAAVFLLTGCAAPLMKFNPDTSAPQLIVEPVSIRLGVVTLIDDTRIVFQGKGFDPGDSVFINITNAQLEGKIRDVPIADAVVDPEGGFRTEVTKIAKITELLRADVGLNEEMENYIVVTRPSIPEGRYVVRAMGIEAGKQAECPFEIKGPSLIDSLKDRIYRLLGKIEKQ